MTVPVLFIPHGGGPLPLLGEPGHALLVNFLKTISQRFATPKAIIVISAHWEERQTTVLSGAHPPLYYDYYNFPPESYQLQYPVPGAPELASQLVALLSQQGIAVAADSQRGFDHGLFVPLTLMYPDADIPCLQLSLVDNMDPATHIAVGKALASLRASDVLILGSGSSYHNMQAPRPGIDPGEEDIRQFDQWLVDTCSAGQMTAAERSARMINWLAAPHARFCHPREEHLLPLHVCFGAACQENGDTPAAELVFNGPMMGRTMLSFLWQ